MSRGLFAAAVLAAFSIGANAQCQEIAGNYYCDQVDSITYNNVGFAGTYNQITSMDNTTCACSSSPVAFSGPLAPLNEEVSFHWRGPVNLAQVAVYYRSGASKMAKREAEPEPEHDHHLNRHKRGHGHRHERRGAVTVTETTYTTSTQTNFGALGAIAPLSGLTTPCTTSTTTSAAAAATGADWVRSSYFNAATEEADNIVFLNHMGGTAGSGTWDTCFGNTLSYAAANGVDGAASPQVFASCTLPSDQEIVLFTAEPCDETCAFVRSGTPAYKGFSTAEDVVFLVDFMMPRDSSSGFNVDMSAAWFLNAQIPRTLQYGSATCSCWTSGCGEFDVFEILSTGSDFLTTTIHSWQGTGTEFGGGGSSDYIERPLTSYMQAAIIFDAATSQFIITTLDTTGDFASGLTDSQVDTWAAPASAATVNIA